MEWIDTKKQLPEYTVQAMGNRCVSVIADFNGFVTETLYEEGEWKPMNIEGVNVIPDYWMYLPESKISEKREK